MKTDKGQLQLVQQRFARQAHKYVTSKSHASGTDLELLLEMAQPRSDWLVLDVATGGGHTALKVAPYVARVIASDVSQPMLCAARRHAVESDCRGIAYVCAEAGLLPYPTQVFDLVTCRIAAHHFGDVHGFVSESWRVLKTGGRYIIQDHVLPDDAPTAQYVEEFERLRDPSHNRAFTEQEWREALETAGFSVDQIQTLTKRHSFLDWAKRQNCSPETTDELVAVISGAPLAAAEWLQPRDFDGPEASFVNHHILLAGTKDRAPSTT
jgi:ubiquinone/menaquinone biosynthesis C-methylase UbiE